MINKQKAIDNIITYFDWEKVHKVMNALKWEWATLENGGKIPTVGELFNCALKLLHEAYDKAQKERTNYTVGTGGFYAECIVDSETKEITELQLRFEVTHWEYYE